MNKFEELIESWVNGNRKWVFEEYLKLSPGDRYDFIEYVRTYNNPKIMEDILSTFLKNFITD